MIAKGDFPASTLDGKTVLRGGSIHKMYIKMGSTEDDIGNEADNEFDESELGITGGSEIASGTYTRYNI